MGWLFGKKKENRPVEVMKPISIEGHIPEPPRPISLGGLPKPPKKEVMRLQSSEFPAPIQDFSLPEIEAPQRPGDINVQISPIKQVQPPKKQGFIIDIEEPIVHNQEIELPEELPDFEPPQLTSEEEQPEEGGYKTEESQFMPMEEHFDIKEEVPKQLQTPRMTQEINGIMFITMGQFDAIRENLEDARDKLKRSESAVENINALCLKEELILGSWHNTLENIERKLNYVDETLFEKRE